jgi:hypothetical protein
LCAASSGSEHQPIVALNKSSQIHGHIGMDVTIPNPSVPGRASKSPHDVPGSGSGVG